MIATITKDVDVSIDEFDDADVIRYVEDSLGKVVLDPENMEEERESYDHPRSYIDTKDKLREHLINILGLGHFVSNDDIILKITEILQ